MPLIIEELSTNPLQKANDVEFIRKIAILEINDQFLLTNLNSDVKVNKYNYHNSASKYGKLWNKKFSLIEIPQGLLCTRTK